MITFLQDYPRLAAGPRLYLLGWRKGLIGRIEHLFMRTSAMLVMRGSGAYSGPGGLTRVLAPSFFLARAGQSYEYGPDTEWDEFHVVYDVPPADLALAGWPDCPLPIADPAGIAAMIDRAVRLCANPAVPGVVDQLDRLPTEMLLAARYGAGSGTTTGPMRRVYEAEQWIRGHFGEDFELDMLAEQFGFSVASFRRWWSRRFELSPWQYVLNLRLKEAQRLLLTDRHAAIGRIARRVGFSDQRYFATIFRKHTGMSPTSYRKAHASR